MDNEIKKYLFDIQESIASIHKYQKIDNEIVWGTIVRHLPTLKTEIDGLLE